MKDMMSLVLNMVPKHYILNCSILQVDLLEQILEAFPVGQILRDIYTSNKSMYGIVMFPSENNEKHIQYLAFETMKD